MGDECVPRFNECVLSKINGLCACRLNDCVPTLMIVCCSKSNGDFDEHTIIKVGTQSLSL